MGQHRIGSTIALVCAVVAVGLLPAAAQAAGAGPTAIGQDAQGVSYVGFASGGTIARYDGSGNALSSWGTPGTGVGQLGGIVGISVDPSGNVWVLDTNLRVQEFTASGSYEGGFTLPPCASGLTPDPVDYGGLAVTASSVYVAHPCDDTILRYSLTGSQYAVRTLESRPRGIAVGPAGSQTNQVFVALPDSHEVDTFDGANFAQNSSEPPLGFSGDPAGVQDKNDSGGDELIVSDVATDYIYIFDPSHLNGPGGTYSEYRTLGHGPGTSAGSVTQPVAFALHANDGSGYDSNLFIADYGNQRIQRWNDSGYEFWAASAVSGTSGGGGSVPTNTAPPAISGTPVVGQSVTCSTGTWTGSPGSYEYSWADNGTVVSALTPNNNGYTVQTGDVGKALTCSVVAVNGSGNSQAATSASVTPSASASAPANTSQPFITGRAAQGGTLTCNTGTWTGTAPITYAYAWDRNGVQIATGQTYTVTSTDVGKAITCVQTASNSGGSLSVASSAVTPTATIAGGSVGVTIDNGAVYTNNPAVTLTIVPPSGATSVIVSNDGGFLEPQTFAVAGNDHYSWTLATSGDDRLPKTVYVRFAGTSATAYLTLADDIVLDQTAPTIQSASLAPAGTSAVTDVARIAAVRSGRSWVLHIRAKDTISGVGRVEFARSRTGRITTVRYSRTLHLKRAGAVRWVRVIDRAGNVSRWHRITLR